MTVAWHIAVIWLTADLLFVVVYGRAARHRKDVLAARGRYSAEAVTIARATIAARQHPMNPAAPMSQR